MNNTFNNTEDILENNICGFHKYILNDPVHVTFASSNLCKMLGYEKKELQNDREDLYGLLVHPSDRGRYFEFINRLKKGAASLDCEYRLIKKDKTAIYVKDSFTVEITDDGSVIGYSVLTDITDIKKENNNLQFLNETIPCGFLKYTCEKQPKVTYINEKMIEFLRIPETNEAELDYLEMYKSNIFLMIPMEERRKFTLYLNRVYSVGIPIAGEMTVLRCDGTRAHLFGWVTKCINEEGSEEFQSVCMDVTERHKVKKANETKRYLKALSDVYDRILEFDLSSNTVKCLHSNDSEQFKWIENISMQMEEATEKWITSKVVSEQREQVRAFFNDFRQKKLYKIGEKPPQISYRVKISGGEFKIYSGIFLKIDDSVSLYCSRAIQDSEETDALRDENVSLKENMQKLVMKFTEGIAAFEISDKYVTPLYASENVCEFFGFTKEEWLPLMKQSSLIEDFVSRSRISYDDILELLHNGEAEFTYYDVKNEGERRIKAICSPRTAASGPRYVMLYNIEATGTEKNNEERGPYVSIRTFGYFDVFVCNKPIAFRNKKSKELFALLVDRRGGYVSSEEAISFLWEDEAVSSVTLARYRKVALRLKNILEEYGISDVVETVDGKRRIVTERVKCDLYDYLSGREEYSQLFKGSYLTNYSWGETTLAELTGDILYQ